MANIIGTNGNDTLEGTYASDKINGKAGNDTIIASEGSDRLTGGGGNDKFVYKDDYYYYSDLNYYLYYSKIDTITDFDQVAKGTNSTAAVIAEVDTLIFQSDGFTVQNLLLTQNGNNLEITFEKGSTLKVILQNFALQNLNNPSLSTAGTFGLGNIEFDNQTSITKSFDVFNANSTQSTIFNENTVTFLNELNNNVSGFDNSNDVINGQGGNDKIDGKSGNDILKGNVANDTLIGGAGNDTLRGYTGVDYFADPYYKYRYIPRGYTGNDSLFGGIGDDRLYTDGSSGNNTLNGGAGDDSLNASFSYGNNLLSGGDGNDFLDTSAYYYYDEVNDFSGVLSSGNNTLNGGAGDDRLNARFSSGNNLLSGGDGNDFFDLSSIFFSDLIGIFGYNTRDSSVTSLVTQTVDGGIGDDVLTVGYFNSNKSYGRYYQGTTSNSFTEGIITTFNPTDNIGSITFGKNRVSYKNIEGLNIQGSYYDDLIVGTNGNDTLSAAGHVDNDTMDGGKGDDLLIVDYSFGYSEGITTTFNATDNIGSITFGKNRASYKNIERLNIFGTYSNDLIVGTNGNDTLEGYGGNDILIGGDGTDTFAFGSFGSIRFSKDYYQGLDYGYDRGIDTIYDFNATNELIQIQAYYFGSDLSTASLEKSQFTIGTSATTSTQRIIYNNITGALYIDLDGSDGWFTQIQFAQLEGGLSLTEKNFVIV
ncbi:calcium-binding protein [Nostoc sp. CHAB 5836]|uniref:calcium-binding protein n=1 Tax=Nostoc sp. CHAB 5836 TaxID=2780404 RepID=UPI001E551583|nr:calcium-binding protein [Nostoc sp. CHAB 5836]MCC5616069.1 calcium-binding protein [Nostoc sp. CHAB 5836]